MDVGTIVTSVISAVMGSAALTSTVNQLAKRRNRRADAAETLTDTAMEITKALRADAAEARKDAEQARRDASLAHQRMNQVQEQAEVLARRLRQLIATIHDPYMTLERLRHHYPIPPSDNGVDDGKHAVS